MSISISLRRFQASAGGLRQRQPNNRPTTSALPAIDEAVSIYRQLARNNPEYPADMHAASLRTQATILSVLGRSAEAKAARDEATAVSAMSRYPGRA